MPLTPETGHCGGIGFASRSFHLKIVGEQREAMAPLPGHHRASTACWRRRTAEGHLSRGLQL